jgi:Na+/H+ antiporter
VEAAQAFVFLLVAVAALAGLARRISVPYPVALVVGGLAIGLVPGLPEPELDPDVVFFAFLPALLYSAAFLASAYELRDHAQPIGLLAVGLVLATVVGVAAAGHYLLGLEWVPAFVLGAVLGPTDPVSASAVIRRLGAPARIETILEGEALVNDGTGLTAYKVAVGAAGASVTVLGVLGSFAFAGVAGVAIGFAVGYLLSRLRALLDDASIDLTLSLLAPFAAYVGAQVVGSSGVLAAVTAGLVAGHRSLDLTEAPARLRTQAFWESLSFLLNSLLFLLIGLQLPQIIDRIHDTSLLALTADALLVSVVVMGLRLAWMFLVPPLITGMSSLGIPVEPSYTHPRERLVLGWSGMRGAVSLAAALAIPADVPGRDELIVLAFGAVVVTLVVPSLTLAPLVTALGLGQTEARRREEADARERLAHTALEALADMDARSERVVDLLRARYETRLSRAEALGDQDGDGHSHDSGEAERLSHAAIEAQREDIQRMARERAFHADLLRTLERELDLEESRLFGRSRG